MARASIEDFEVHISPSLLLPEALEQSKWLRRMVYILLNKEIDEVPYVGAEGVHKEGGCEEGRLKDEVSARC